jgi:ankyrin repeat protein
MGECGLRIEDDRSEIGLYAATVFQSEIRNYQSAICIPQSSIFNLQYTTLMDRALQLRLTIEAGDMAEALSLLDEHPELIESLTGEHATPLHVAALHDRAAIVEQLLARGADVEARTTWDGTPLVCALVCGHERTAALLADRAITPRTLRTLAGLGLVDQIEACFNASGRLRPGLGSTRSVAKAADSAADERATNGWTFEGPIEDEQAILNDALEYAARNGKVDAAKALILRGALIDGRGFFGATPLHWAVANGKLSAVEALLDHGADVNARDSKYNSTVLAWAREFRRDTVASLLVRRGGE